MTPDPPPSPEGSPLQSRHRPVLGDLANTTTELDLWSFDDEIDEDVLPVLQPLPLHPRPLSSPQSGGRVVPERRDSRPGTSKAESKAEDSPSPADQEQIRLNAGRSVERRRTLGDFSNTVKPAGDFDDLEQWDTDSSPEDEGLDELPEVLTEEVIRKEYTEIPQGAPAGGSAPADISAEVVSSAKATLEKSVSGDDELSPVLRDGGEPVSLRPHLGLTKVEKVGMLTLLVMLLAAGFAIYQFSVNRLPTESIKAKANDFPIKGSRLTVTSAESYWRVPVVDGPTADVFRRGTELLPVVEIAVSGGSGAIRVVFRDESRRTMGDSITRSVEGKDLLKIVATAGFEDMGMYAAYRTGGNKPWIVEVLEGSSADAPSAEFQKLFEMELSTAIR